VRVARKLIDRRNDLQDSARLLKQMESEQPVQWRIGKSDLLAVTRTKMVNDMLADMCRLIVKTIALIPPEHDDERLSACAFVLDQINEAVERMVNDDRTEH
jgi:hypothetical protein